MRTTVKICGITRPRDAVAAAAAGADAIGLVFSARSARCVTIPTARSIVAVLPPFVSVVALFVDAEPAEVAEVLANVSVDCLQFHGEESPDYCASFGRRYIKAMPMKGGVEPEAYAARYPDAAAFLVDSHAPGEIGGTGKVFDWSNFPRELAKPVLLAGGLSPENVAEAIRRCEPYGVDVSSGVETDKGIKDHARMATFIEEVERVRQH